MLGHIKWETLQIIENSGAKKQWNMNDCIPIWDEQTKEKKLQSEMIQ